MEEVTMPKLSDSMEAGRIIAWRVQQGDPVSEGDVLAEVESDKATMELECFHNGTVARILHGDDSEVPVGEVIALIAEEGETAADEPTEARKPTPKKKAKKKRPAAKPEKAPAKKQRPAAKPRTPRKPSAPKPPGERLRISPYARKLAEGTGVDPAQLHGSGPGGRIVARDIQAAAKDAGRAAQPARAAKPAPSDESDVEPIARTLAERYGVDLDALTGTGLGGRITVADVLAARAERPAPPRPPADEELPPLDVTEDEATVEDAPFRLKTQARIVTASKHVIPHFYVTRSVDVTALMARKAELKERFGASITHLVMLACLKTLQDHPQLSRSYDHGRIITWKGIHLGLAVDTDQGLTVGVLRDAQGLSLREIVERTSALVDKARVGKLSAEERRHPTFTITNLGMFDVEHFQPIINPPCPITLAVASALEQPVVRAGGLAVGRVMRLTTSCDHRIVEGVDAAAFLRDLRGLLESPEELLVGQE